MPMKKTEVWNSPLIVFVCNIETPLIKSHTENYNNHKTTDTD